MIEITRVHSHFRWIIWGGDVFSARWDERFCWGWPFCNARIGSKSQFAKEKRQNVLWVFFDWLMHVHSLTMCKKGLCEFNRKLIRLACLPEDLSNLSYIQSLFRVLLLSLEAAEMGFLVFGLEVDAFEDDAEDDVEGWPEDRPSDVLSPANFLVCGPSSESSGAGLLFPVSFIWLTRAWISVIIFARRQ